MHPLQRKNGRCVAIWSRPIDGCADTRNGARLTRTAGFEVVVGLRFEVMSRWRFLVFLVGSACAAPEAPAMIAVPPAGAAPLPPPDVVPQNPPAPSSDPLTGALGSHAFTARSALLVQPNSLSTRCTTDKGQRRCEEDIPVSYIRILERNVTCADLTGPAERPDVRIGPNEHSIEVVLQARWPVASGTVLGTDATMSVPRIDHVTAAFKDGSQGGAVASGSARFTNSGSATMLTLDLATTSSSLSTSGRVHGTIPLVACPARATGR